MTPLKSLLVATALSSLTFGAPSPALADRTTVTDPATTVASNEAIIEGLFAAFNAHDADALAAFYAEDAVVYSPESCTPTVGADAIAAGYAEMFAQIPDVHDALEVVVWQGDRAAVIFTASSQIEGAAFELPISAFLTFEDGKIVEDRVFFDTDMAPDCG